jgi:hypothetical protein
VCVGGGLIADLTRLCAPLTRLCADDANLSFIVCAPLADDANLSFIAVESDRVTGEPVRRLMAKNAVKSRALFKAKLLKVAAKESGGSLPRDMPRKIEWLADFLDRATALDPAARLTPSEAMDTPFIAMAKKEVAAQHAALKARTGRA